MKCVYHISQSSESIHLSNMLGGSASILQLLTPGYMPWGGAGGQNVEHPHTGTLTILSSFIFFFVSNAF